MADTTSYHKKENISFEICYSYIEAWQMTHYAMGKKCMYDCLNPWQDEWLNVAALLEEKLYSQQFVLL